MTEPEEIAIVITYGSLRDGLAREHANLTTTLAALDELIAEHGADAPVEPTALFQLMQKETGS
jgi:hypothetical protein